MLNLSSRRMPKQTQQKRRRVPILLQEAVEVEIDKLLKEGHNRKVKKSLYNRGHCRQERQICQAGVRCQIPE